MPALVAEAARLRPTRSRDAVTAATKASLSSLAHRIQALDDELAELDRRIEALLDATAPELLDVFGVGPDTAAALLVSGRRQPRAPAFRSRLGPPVRRRTRSRPRRARPTGTGLTTVATARPTARSGAS